MDKALKILTILFFVHTIAAVVIYFALPDNRVLFFTMGGVALSCRILYYFLRFISR